MEGQRTGPYVLRHRLGAGGMGEVWEGWDERLRRRVAIKRLSHAGSPASRERLLREARTVAALAHPSIVAIHDVVEEADGLSLVLELVEGTTIRQIVERDGPLPESQVIDLGLQIASALAAAHERGIIHRDLKTENVMRTPGGRIKVLDFGIARSPEAEGTLAPDGQVVGTLRAMSPEQALGRDVDSRTDLFSLGVLLYEAATGVSPFRGEGPADTLRRICTHQPPPARQLVPSLSAGLSGAIDRLLEKDRAHRPQDARAAEDALRVLQTSTPAPPPERTVGEPTIRPQGTPPTVSGSFAPAPARSVVSVVALIAVLAGALLLFLLWPRHGTVSEKPRRIAVLRPVVSGDTADPLTGTAVRLAVLRALAGAPRTDVVPFEEADAVGTAGNLPPARLATALAADEIVLTRVECRALLCQVQIERRRPGKVLAAIGFEAPADRLLFVNEGVEDRVRTIYGLKDRDRTEDLSPEDHRAYLELWQAFDAAPNGLAAREIQEKLGALRQRAPGFVDLYLLEARVSYLVWNESRQDRDLQRTLSLLATARQLSQDSFLPDLIEAGLWIDAGRLDQADRLIAGLVRQRPGNPLVLQVQAQAAERRGDGEEALRLMRRTVALCPSWQQRLNLARLAQRQGKVQEARAQLEAVLAILPGQPRALALLGQIELVSGDLERATRIFARLAANAPRATRWSNLGLAHLFSGRTAEAADAYRRAEALAPDNPGVALNLADALALLGRRGEAGALYERVLTLTAQPAPDDWQALTVRGQALAHLGRPREAVTALQSALRISSGGAQTAYEAALIYTLVGDRTSALASAESALRGGIQPRWFSLPWFRELCTDPELQDLLGRHSPPGRSPSPGGS